ncbi:MAG TPA: tetratricopeptide repeat protein [Candidatus Acidoferrales bacterium]|nr:tetratricopeptide repeat protein [Candidatus Acidoferrales bacterium]
MKKLHLYVLLVVAVNLVTFVWIPSGQVFAQDQLNHGASLLDNKDCAGALPYLVKAVAAEPKSEKANLYLGNAYLCLGKLDSAELYLTKTIQINDESAPAYYGLGRVLQQKKKYADALKNLESAINYDAKNVGYVVALGQIYLDADSLDLATQAFYKAKDMNDKDPRAFEGIGDVYRKQNIFETAIDNYKSAIQLDSMNIPLRLKLANTYMQDNNGGAAYEEFAKISKLAPNNPDAQYQAGELLYINKRYHDAFTFLEKYHQLAPSNDKALLQLCESAIKGGFYPEAIKYNQEYLSRYPKSVDAKKNLGAAFYFVKKYSDSYNTFKSLPIDSLAINDLVRFGMSANAVHDTVASIDALTRAVTKDTTLSQIENLLAGLLFADKRYEDAITHFKKHLAAEPKDAGAWLNMGLCSFILKDYDNAIEALRNVTRLKPDNVQGWLWLGRSYVFADSLPEAKGVYENVIKIAKDDTSADNPQVMSESYRQVAYSQIIPGTKLQKDNPDAAKKYYNDALPNLLLALKYDSKDTKTHILLAQVFALLGKMDDACRELKNVLKSDPKNEQMLKLQKSLNCE